MTTTPERLSETAVHAAPAAPVVRAVIYARVSQDPKQQLRSVSQQIEESRAECARRGWTIVKIFKDNDRSASRYATKERPEYARLIEFLRSGGADVLVTWESSRAQRDLEVYVALRKVAEKHSVRWSYKGRLYDLSRADDRFSTGLDALLAERESDEIRDRVMRGIRASAENGRPGGRTPFGYVREYDPHTKVFLRQVIREDQAAVIREIGQRIAGGEAPCAVVTDLNRRGVPTARGSRWYPGTVRAMLTNPAYIGKRVHRGKIVADGCWPAILDEETFYACVQRFNSPNRRRSKDGRKERDGKATHLLTGILTCAKCGAWARAVPHSRQGKTNLSCRGTFDGRMGCVTILEESINPYITDQAIARLSHPDAAGVLVSPERTKDAKAALAEAAEKRARLDETADLCARGEMSATMAARIEATLLPQIEAAEQRAREVGIAPVLRGVVRPDIADVWPTLALSQQREVIRTLMDIRLHPATKFGRAVTDEANAERVEILWKHDM